MLSAAKRLHTILLVIGLTVAALAAPPEAFADTTVPTGPTAPVSPGVQTPTAPIAPAPLAPVLPGTSPAPTSPALAPAIQPPTTIAAPHVPPPPAEKPVRIGVGRSQTTATVTAAQGLLVVAGGAVQTQVPAGQTVQVSLVTGQIQVVGLPAPLTGPVRLIPTANPPALNYIAYNSRPYRGEIEILVSSRDRKLSVVNVVNLEEYLLGVVPREMPYTWPLEALKAQAVAARTYSLTHMKGYADEGFDLVPTTTNQEYGGVPAETSQTTQAVTGTRGQVLTFGPGLAGTFYFSSSGGYTENNEVVWGGTPVAYLRGVPDFDDLPGNAYYSWKYNFTLADFGDRLRKKGYDVGTVTGAGPAGSVGASGRPTLWTVTGSTRSVTLRAADLRSTLGLPGLVRTVSVKLSAAPGGTRVIQPVETAYVVGADRTPRAVAMTGVAMAGVGGAPRIVSGQVVATGPQVDGDSGVEVVGGGNGHSIGLSQWGANGLAVLGRTYDQILTYFFRGTKVEARA